MPDSRAEVVWARSDELSLLARPIAGYPALAARDTEGGSRLWRCFRRPALALLVLASFVSVSSSGRFTLWHVAPAFVAWSFLPAIQCAWLFVLWRRHGRARGLAESVDLFFAGQGAWYALALALMGPIVLAPWLADRLLGVHWLLAVVGGALACFAHGVVSSYGFFRGVWGKTRGRAALIATAYYVGFALTILGYYLVMGQLLPVLGVKP